MLTDTHCHLTDERLTSQLDEVMIRAREATVERIIVPSVGLLDGKGAIEIAKKFDYVWALVGVHPEVLSGEADPEYRDEWLASGGEWIQKLRALVASSDKVIGIGEIGLDFYHDKQRVSKEVQMRVFQEQLELAVELSLPVAIHMRDAEEEIGEVLSQMKDLPMGQFHCWSGGADFLGRVLEMGFYVSFCGNITYKSAGELRDLIKTVPVDRLLLETDSPYLAPGERRGSLNEPANVKIIAEYIADLLDLPFETLINQTEANTRCLYFPGL